MIKIMPILLVSAALVTAADAQQEKPRAAFPFFEPVQPPRPMQVMAHRGAMRREPENSARCTRAVDRRLDGMD